MTVHQIEQIQSFLSVHVLCWTMILVRDSLENGFDALLLAVMQTLNDLLAKSPSFCLSFPVFSPHVSCPALCCVLLNNKKWEMNGLKKKIIFLNNLFHFLKENIWRPVKLYAAQMNSVNPDSDCTNCQPIMTVDSAQLWGVCRAEAAHVHPPSVNLPTSSSILLSH